MFVRICVVHLIMENTRPSLPRNVRGGGPGGVYCDEQIGGDGTVYIGSADHNFYGTTCPHPVL